ncbi:Uncharacterised protein [Vibrio cholerae]|nr:Uncharacterised protein [Vibrio cholerae]
MFRTLSGASYHDQTSSQYVICAGRECRHAQQHLYLSTGFDHVRSGRLGRVA